MDASGRLLLRMAHRRLERSARHEAEATLHPYPSEPTGNGRTRLTPLCQFAVAKELSFVVT
jgi:hypothetical protein